MKFEECKIGDIVTLKSGVIKTITAKNKVDHWTLRTKNFIIERLNYTSKTVYIHPFDSLILDSYDFVDPSCLISSTKIMKTAKFDLKYLKQDSFRDKIWRPEDKLDFEIQKEKNELSAYYHGVKLATVRCHPDDAYDEEFGLHLLLRRACLKLKDEHTVVETVEEFLQKP